MGTVIRRNWSSGTCQRGRGIAKKHMLVGPLCTTIDTLAQESNCPPSRPATSSQWERPAPTASRQSDSFHQPPGAERNPRAHLGSWRLCLQGRQRIRIATEWRSRSAFTIVRCSSRSGTLSWRARSEGDRIAIVQGKRTLTFGEWVHAAGALSLVPAVGRRPSRPRALWMDSSPAMAIAIVGLWKAGAIVVLMDPKSKAAQFEHAVRTVSPVAIVCDDRRPYRASTLEFRSSPSARSMFSRSDIDRAGHSALPTDPASIVFTSGSTGRPKGVTQTHGNLIRACDAVTGYLGLSAADRILCCVPWSFDYGYGQLLRR